MRWWSVVAGAILLAGCGGEPAPERTANQREPARAASVPATDSRPVIVAYGDSITSGFGSAADQPFTRFLQQELDRRGYSFRVVNAGVPGDTTGSGLARVESVIALKPAIVIVEFGGNDGLRGLPLLTVRANLDELIGRLKQAGIRVLLAGVTLPPNYGPDYVKRFEGIYADLARKHDITLTYLHKGSTSWTQFVQPDGIHPTAEGNRILAGNLLRAIEPMLQ
jgi:acyl-CoA thioesterase-1